ncbi:HNH endonuclease [Brachybacterium alimentarium]|uniref:HNH endonuclease n=1 Tax=Brachybacterium alimentarium TaxID=47845 RepID=UPI003FD4C017
MAESCSIEGCGTKRYARGWCEKHYTRWRRNGDPNVTQRHFNPADALDARTERRGRCLIWTGAIDRAGYGMIRTEGRTLRPHRVAWELSNGPVPEGKFLDHICWNRACVDLSHLRVVTRQQNNSYLSGPKGNRDLPRNVSRHKGVYTVRVNKDGRRYYVGSYHDLADATRAAENKRSELFGIYAGR